MLATLPYAHLLPAPAKAVVSACAKSASNLYPPIMEVCEAQADPGRCQNPICLVSKDVFCEYRLSLTSLGNYCLHPLHEKILQRTVEAKDKEKNTRKPPE